MASGCAGPSIPDVQPASGIALPSEYYADTRPPAGLDDVWWRGFEDEQLDALVEKALKRNQSLEASRQRLLAAKAIIRAEQSDLLPSVDGQFSADGALDDGGNTFSGSRAGLFGSWTIDFNGRLSAETARALANADGAAYFLADQRRLIAAAVTSQHIELKRSGARLELLDQSTDLQQQTLRIVNLRFEAGLSSNLDVRRAAADVARTRAQRGPLQLARARAANALSVLVGDPPSAVPPTGNSVSIPDYREGPAIGIPADLLRRRPDLLLAEADVAAAAANVGIERADLLPAFALSGGLLLGDGSVEGLFARALASLATALDIPVFDGGRRKAEVDAAKADLQAEVADYRQSLLETLAEVESAIAAIASARERKEELEKAVAESEAAFNQSNALYREGLASLFDVLDVQRQLISSREALIDGEADLSQSYVQLYSAVGSDVPPRAEPQEAEL
ncbi:TolC family protein [Erythrobacter insulae]|uniref:TolC family protein n=1 Tax=Erythrobacter insulae TaxID=2584124 RepID=A0A547PCD5_9SPHN|nr:TolC family protein [Erythrobacter insulae]TRD11791.1 TolC family protein [Erythrobacter insulae]